METSYESQSRAPKLEPSAGEMSHLLSDEALLVMLQKHGANVQSDAERNTIIQIFGIIALRLQHKDRKDGSPQPMASQILPFIMRSLRRFKSDLELQPASLAVIAWSARVSLATRELYGHEEICELVAEMMKVNPCNPLIQAEACQAVAFLVEECSENVERFLRAGILVFIPIIIQSKVLSKDVRVQANCLRAIHALTANGDTAYDVGSQLGGAGACEAVVRALQAFPRDTAVIDQGFECITILAPCSQANRVRLGKAGTCELIAKVLQSFPDDPIIIDWGLKNVTTLSVDCVENRRAFGEANVCELILQALKTFPDQLFETGLKAVRVLAQDAECREILGASGAFDLALSKLRSSKSPSVQILCCSTIAALAHSKASKRSKTTCLLNQAGAAAQLVYDVIDAHPKEAAIQAAGWGAMAKLAALDPLASRQIGRRRGCERVMQIVKDFSEDSRVWTSACDCIGAFVVGVEENERVLIRLGACNVIIEALTKFAEDADTTATACYALGIFAETSPSNRATFDKAEVCQILIQVCKGFKSSALVQFSALHAIGVMAKSAVNMRESLREHGTNDVIVKAMQTHPENSATQYEALSALAILAKDDQHIQHIFIAAAAPQCIMETMQCFSADEDMQTACCEAFLSLMEGPDVHDLLIDQGLFPILLKAMMLSTTHQRLQLGCMKVLRMLCEVSDEVKQAINEDGRYEVLIQAFKEAQLAINEQIAAEACQVIRQLANGSRLEVLGSLGSVGFCELVLQAMKTHPKDQGVQKAGCLAVFNLALLSNNRTRLNNANAPDYVLKAINRLMHDSSTQAAGFLSIALLSMHGRKTKKGRVDEDGFLYDMILQGLSRFLQEASFQSCGCRIAAMLACEKGEEASLHMSTNGTLGLIIKALRTHAADASVQICGWNAVKWLSRSKHLCRMLLHDQGACELILSTLSSQDQITRQRQMVERRCLEAMISLASSPENQSQLGNAGSCGWLLDAMKRLRHTYSPRLLCIYIDALLALVTDHKENLHQVTMKIQQVEPSLIGALSFQEDKRPSDMQQKQFELYGRGVVLIETLLLSLATTSYKKDGKAGVGGGAGRRHVTLPSMVKALVADGLGQWITKVLQACACSSSPTTDRRKTEEEVDELLLAALRVVILMIKGTSTCVEQLQSHGGEEAIYHIIKTRGRRKVILENARNALEALSFGQRVCE